MSWLGEESRVASIAMPTEWATSARSSPARTSHTSPLRTMLPSRPRCTRVAAAVGPPALGPAGHAELVGGRERLFVEGGGLGRVVGARPGQQGVGQIGAGHREHRTVPEPEVVHDGPFEVVDRQVLVAHRAGAHPERPVGGTGTGDREGRHHRQVGEGEQRLVGEAGLAPGLQSVVGLDHPEHRPHPHARRRQSVGRFVEGRDPGQRHPRAVLVARLGGQRGGCGEVGAVGAGEHR